MRYNHVTTNGKTLFIEAKENEVIKTKDIKAAEMNDDKKNGRASMK